MANKYTALPMPPKDEMESLYKSGMTQTELGLHYGVSQKVIFGWFKRTGIKSRIAKKRNQTREKNSSWKGDDITYAAAHYRVKALRGQPMKCEICGTEAKNIHYDWASLTHDYNNPYDYKRMCRSCHFKFDGIANNLGKYKGNRFAK